MRKGYLAIFLVLMMAIGVASSVQAYDDMAEPSAALLVPFVVANNSNEAIGIYQPGDDTAIAIANVPRGPDLPIVIDWTFFDDLTSAHLRDKKITVTPGAIGGGPYSSQTGVHTGFLWSIEKGEDFDGELGYLVFAFPDLDSSSLTANAFFIDNNINFAAFIPTLQLIPGVDIVSDSANSDYPPGVYQWWSDAIWKATGNPGAALLNVTSPPAAEIRAPGDRIWSSPRAALNGIPYDATIFPRYSNTVLAHGNAILNTQSLMVFWQPSASASPHNNAIQYNTINEATVSCSIEIIGELVVLDPFLDVIGEDPFPEGAFLITNWGNPIDPDEDRASDGGISWTFILGYQGDTIVEAQTSLTPHWGGTNSTVHPFPN